MWPTIPKNPFWPNIDQSLCLNTHKLEPQTNYVFPGISPRRRPGWRVLGWVLALRPYRACFFES